MSDNYFAAFLNNDAFKNFTTGNDLPFDSKTIFESYRKNLQAVSQANQLIVDAAQTVAKHQTEMLSQIVEDQSTLARELMSEGAPQDKVAKHADLVKKAYEKSISNLNKLSSVLSKSQTDASEILNKRVVASLNELKASAEKTKKAA